MASDTSGAINRALAMNSTRKAPLKLKTTKMGKIYETSIPHEMS